MALEPSAFTAREEPFEKQRQMEREARLHAGKKSQSAGWLGPETEVVPLSPNQVLANIKQVAKDQRDSGEFVGVKAEENVPDVDGRGQRGREEQKGLYPVYPTLGQRARKEQMFRGFGVISAEACRRNIIPERNQAVSGVEDTMSDLPAQVDALTVQRHEKEGPPGGDPVKVSKDRAKFRDAVWHTWVKRQKKLTARLARKCLGRKARLGTNRQACRGG